MAESSSVRLLQHHLRQAGAALAARQFETASAQIHAALAIDPASLAALTLRERLTTLRAQSHQQAPPAARPVEPSPSEPKRFVPAGVNAASWQDFEHRIQERRFRALIDTADRAVASGDGVAARAAIEEAGELKPDAGEVTRLSARIAMLQIPAASPVNENFFRSRTFRAVSLLLLGVTLLMGLDWVRSGTPQPGDRVQLASSSPTAEPAVIEPSDTATVPTSEGTSGNSPERLPLTYRSTVLSSSPAPVVEPSPLVDNRPASTETPDNYVALPSIRPVRIVAAPPIIRGEVPDDYVTPRRQVPREIVAERDAPVTNLPPRASATAAPLTSVVRQPAPLVESLSVPAAPPASPPLSLAPSSATVGTLTTPVAPSRPVPAAAIAPPGISDDTRVTAVLNQYASAYGQLNAAAVRSIWPSVDERALSRAFSSLSSQSMSFDNCDVTVTGPTAHASCHGRASYVAKVGSKEKRNEPRTVHFELKRDGDAWKIMKAETSR